MSRFLCLLFRYLVDAWHTLRASNRITGTHPAITTMIYIFTTGADMLIRIQGLGRLIKDLSRITVHLPDPSRLIKGLGRITVRLQDLCRTPLLHQAPPGITAAPASQETPDNRHSRKLRIERVFHLRTDTPRNIFQSLRFAKKQYNVALNLIH